MKRLSEPDNSMANTLLDGIIKRKRNKEYITRLTANKIYIIKRYTVYQEQKNKLENIGASIIYMDEDKDAIHTAFSTSFKKRIKKSELKKVYDECNNICPFCGDRKIEEIDHYIPKEAYPEFTLYPGNLVPLCNKCNKKKGERFLDTENKRQFINVYYDDIDNLNFISINIQYNPTNIKKTIRIKYLADFELISDLYLREIVCKHYKNLDLLERYEEAAINEVSELLMVVQNQSNKDEHDIEMWGTMTIEGKMNGQLKLSGYNDWKYLLYKKLVEINFITDLVKYVSENMEKYD